MALAASLVAEGAGDPGLSCSYQANASGQPVSPDKIGSVGRRGSDKRFATRGQYHRAQVAYAGIEAKQIPAPDSATKRDIINRFTNVLYDLTRRGLVEKIGHGPGARWQIPLATRSCCDAENVPFVRRSARRFARGA
jgi:hypothetical protein